MTEYRWSAERHEHYWPSFQRGYGVRVLLNGKHMATIFCPTKAEAQSLIDWINRTDLGECPEWATLMPAASGAALRANDPDGEWQRLVRSVGWCNDHHAASDGNYFIRRTPAPAEPLTERVPLAECLGREVLVDGERRVVVGVDTRLAEAWWYSHEASAPYIFPVAPDGTVEVLRRSTEDGER